MIRMVSWDSDNRTLPITVDIPESGKEEAVNEYLTGEYNILV
eukprot:SAG11_NODE_9666_length_891_cov_0.671717_2_plen_42_part_00